MSLALLQIQTPTANRFAFNYSGFDQLIGTTYETLAALVQAVSLARGTQLTVVATYDLLGTRYHVTIHEGLDSSGPHEDTA